MTPKQKAKNLVDKFQDIEMLNDWEGMYMPLAKQCALICVDEILDAPEIGDGGLDMYEPYWQEVKQEIAR